MSYEDCQKIVDATKDIFEGTNYGIAYYLDAEIYFTLNGEAIMEYEVPEPLLAAFNNVVLAMDIEF